MRDDFESSERRSGASRRRMLLSYTGRVKGSLLSGTVIMMLSILFDLLAPFMIGYIVDREMPNVRSPGWTWTVLILLIGAFLCCVLIASVLRYAGTYRLNGAANRVVQFMQNDAFEHLQELPIQYFDNLPAGTVVSKITNDTKAVRVLFELVLSQLLSASLYAVGILIALAFVDYRLMLLALAALPFIYLVIRDYRGKASRYTREFRRSYGELNGTLNESLQNMSIIQSLNHEDQILVEFDEINDEVYRHSVDMSNLYAYSAYNITQALQYLMLTLVLILFGYSQFSGVSILPIGHLYIFIDYMTKLFNQVSNTMSRIGDMERSFSAADQILDFLETTPESRFDDTASPERLNGEVEFESVTFAYKDEPVLKDISFKVRAGENVAFVGATGSGKSTIMNLLLGFYRPQKGRLRFDHKDQELLDRRHLRSQIAIVLQEPYLFAGTIYSNIALGDRSITKEEAFEALSKVGGSALLSRLEKGIDSPVNEKGAYFSAGERQLITFARALVRDPRILVLDEATSSVDSETESMIQQGIETLSSGRTTFVIAHRLSTICDADRIFVLDKGRIVEQGTHNELIELNGIYHELLLAAQQNLTACKKRKSAVKPPMC